MPRHTIAHARVPYGNPALAPLPRSPASIDAQMMTWQRVLEILRDSNKSSAALAQDWQQDDPSDWPGVKLEDGELVELWVD